VQGCQEGVARLLFDKKVSRVWRRFEWAVNEWSDNLKLTAKHRSAIEFLLDAEVVSLAEAVWWAAENNCLFSFGQMMRSKESRFSARYTSAWCEALMQAAHRGMDAAVEELISQEYMNYAHFKHYLGEVLQVIEQAARAGYRQIVGPLVSRWNPETVFIEAARTGFEATVQAMLEKDQPNLWNVPRHLGESRPGHGALSAAVENGHKGVARIILEASRTGINATGDERGAPLCTWPFHENKQQWLSS